MANVAAAAAAPRRWIAANDRVRAYISRADVLRRVEGGLVRTAPWLPSAMLVATASVAIGAPPGNGVLTVAQGVVLGLGFWTIAGTLIAPLVGPEACNPTQFHALQARLTELGARLDATRSANRHAEEARAAFHEAEKLFEDHDPKPWVLGSGYNEVWKRLHQVTQNLSHVEDEDEVLLAVSRVRYRLNESTIDSKKDLLADLDAAFKKGGRVSKKARGVLENAARIVDEYRDGRWDKMINLMQDCRFYTAGVGVLAYALFAFVVTPGISSEAVFAATMYLIIGAIVGFLSRSESRPETAATVEDFGLDRARTGLAILTGGVVAALSVGLVAMLANASITTLIQPPVATDTADAAKKAVDLATPYNLSEFPGGLLIAAIFGLTPKLFFSSIVAQGEKIKTQLQSTEAGEEKK